jgi:heterodisulfide reductase subunit C
MAQVNLFKKLSEDIRFIEGLTACINCGTCTAICPAAQFYNYDPRIIDERDPNFFSKLKAFNG